VRILVVLVGMNAEFMICQMALNLFEWSVDREAA
jgi:hypothetical protein